MSVQSQVEALTTLINETYSIISDKGGFLPSELREDNTMEHLKTSVESIPVCLLDNSNNGNFYNYAFTYAEGEIVPAGVIAYAYMSGEGDYTVTQTVPPDKNYNCFVLSKCQCYEPGRIFAISGL